MKGASKNQSDCGNKGQKYIHTKYFHVVLWPSKMSASDLLHKPVVRNECLGTIEHAQPDLFAGCRLAVCPFLASPFCHQPLKYGQLRRMRPDPLR